MELAGQDSFLLGWRQSLRPHLGKSLAPSQSSAQTNTMQTYFRLPEPKGLTYADLDVLFENKVSARHFRKVEVDPYRSDTLVVVEEDSVSEHEVHQEKKY